MSETDHLRCNIPADWSDDFSQCLYEWQGLEAGSIAILAAVIGYLAVHKQIRYSKEADRRRAVRVFESRRSTLPLVLSNVSGYAEDVIRALSEARTILREREARLTGAWAPPVFPSDVSVELREFVEASDNILANALVLELLRQLQTLRSRLTSLVTEEATYQIGRSRNVAEYQIQSAKIRQLCGALFPFARGETDIPPTSLDRQASVDSLRFIDHLAEDDPDFAQMTEIFLRVERPWWPKDDR